MQLHWAGEKSVEENNEFAAISNIFVVLATRRYVDALKNNKKELLAQIELGRKYNKDCFILIDKSIGEDDIKILDEKISGLKIIKRFVDNLNPPTIARILKDIETVYCVEDVKDGKK